jgi:hypothetical protein
MAQNLLETSDMAPLNKKKPNKAEKITATIYAADWERLDQIKDFFRHRGYRNLSDSEALRIAFRAVQIDETLIAYYEASRHEDNRRSRKIA